MRVPASYHQERLWFIDEFESFKLYSSSPTYHNIPLILKINGELDILKLEKAFNDVIARHEVLRTKIVTIDNKPYQSIEEPKDAYLKIEVIDVLDSASDEEELIRKAKVIAKMPFLLRHDFLVRGFSIRCAGLHRIVCFVFHHLIADRYSVRRFLLQLCNPQGSETESPALQYADFSEWQRKLPPAALNKHRQYWRTIFNSEAEPLTLPFCKPRPQIHVYNEGTLKFRLEKNIVDVVGQFTKNNSVSTEAVYLAAFSILLMKCSAQSEVNIGTVVSNRMNTETAETLGPIDNLAALRFKFIQNYSLIEYVKSCNVAISEAREHVVMPFDLLSSQLNLAKDMSRTVLFDVCFQYEEEDLTNMFIADVLATPLPTNSGLGKYDINLLIQKRSDETADCIATINDDYYSYEDTKIFFSHFESFLLNFNDNAAVQLKDLSLLSSEENSLLHSFRKPFGENNKLDRIDNFFETIAKKYPERIALSFGEIQLTYCYVNQLADTIARQLMEQDKFQHNSNIAICISNSELLIVLQIAILKTGCAYVPLDPSLPTGRLSFIVSDAQCKIVIVDAPLALADEMPEVDFWMVENFKRPASGAHPSSPVIMTKPNITAYVIYTSGTTGVPKGCVISQTSLANLILNSERDFVFNENDIWILAHAVSFDFSVWEIFGCLLHGARLIIPERSDVLDTFTFKRIVHREKISILNQTPQAFYNFTAVCQTDSRQPLGSHLRYIIFGGEKLEMTYLKKWVEEYPLSQTKLVNMYGITETTVHTTFHLITQNNIDQPSSIIGRPLAGVSTYICDEQLNILPRGAKGEICVGGAGLALGYLNQIDLTAQRFHVSNGERLYRSGDVGMWNHEGNLVYFGRNDSQIKIRGFRIEPEEIKRNLLGHPAVEEVVLKVEGDTEHKQIVAYVRVSVQVTESELRDFLKKSLPAYMLPHVFVFVDSFKLTSNGKLDVSALTRPVIVDNSETRPLGEMEEMLVDVVAEVLRGKRPKHNDDFFLIGGDSIVAIQIISKLYARGYKLDIRDIFSSPRISDLSKAIKPLQIRDSAPVFGEAPLSTIQKRFFKAKHKNPHHYTQGMALHFDKHVATTLIQNIFAQLILHHDGLRTVFLHSSDNIPRLFIQKPNDVLNYEFIDEREGNAHLNESAHISLERALYFIRHVRRKSGDSIEFIIHHLVVDGASWRILIEDFLRLYSDAQAGLTSVPKTSSFIDWSTYLQKIKRTDLEEELNFIRLCKKLNQLPATVSPSRLCELREIILDFDQSTTTNIILANEAYDLNVQEVLLTAFSQGFFDVLQIEVLVICVEGHGREVEDDTIDLSRTIGWFTTIFPVLLNSGSVNGLSHRIIDTKERIRSSSRNARKLMIAQSEFSENAEETTSILFNYLGKWEMDKNEETPFKAEPLHNSVSKENKTEFPVTLNAWISEGRLQLQILTDPNYLNTAACENILLQTKVAMDKIIAHCLEKEEKQRTPSDFSYKKLTIDELDSLFD